MNDSSTNKVNKNNGNGFNKDQNRLLNDPDYKKLLELYQSAEFTKCEKLIEQLSQKYPDEKEIEQIKDDLLMKLSFKDSIDSVSREEKIEKRKKIIKLAIFAVVTTVIISSLTLFISFLIQINRSTKQLEENYVLLTSLEYQADRLLDAGKPQQAAEIVERMKTVDANYEELPELISKTNLLLNLEQDYQNALDLIAQGQESEALEILQEIEKENPGMWDIRNHIELLETKYQFESLMTEGSRAFIAEDWDGVINAYESAQSIDPDLVDPVIKEQLIQAYLNKIIGMLEDQDTTIDDIDNAEMFYRKATSLVSQSKEFASERESLQKASSDLLQVKYTQVAKSALEDKHQTSASIAEAVAFLRKAANLDSENKALSADLQNAENYQVAFKKFLDMKWNEAVSHLKLLLANDPNYANGNANILLYESYYALAKQYYAIGLYLDAIQVLEQAEILVFADTDNLLRLFQVQTLLGSTFGKLNNYEGAVSYFKYAFDAVEAREKLGDYPGIDEKLSTANIEAAYLHFDKAFPLYEEVLDEIDVIYTNPEVEVENGVCLAFVADENRSTLEAIIEANNLPSSMTVSFGRKLIVPTIEN